MRGGHGGALLLGGTGEARALAELLVEAGVGVESSLAGRVEQPRLPIGPVRIGGFGGVDGLRASLRERSVRVVVDATHPFAAGISRNAVDACLAEGVPLLRLERPGWSEAPGAERWHWVDDHVAAAGLAACLGRRPFLTIGRQSLGTFVGPMREHDALVRVVDEPDVRLPSQWTLLRSRGPYRFADERALLDQHAVDVLVTKDSGGALTWPKLEAADALGIEVVVVRRRPLTDDVETVADPAAAARWVRARL